MRVFKLIVISLFAFQSMTMCQNVKDENYIYKAEECDLLAQFPEGNEKLSEFISTNFNWVQGQITVSGNVFVSFTVNSNGSIDDVKLEKGLCTTCDMEAMRLIKSMPKWIPAKKDGKFVRSKMVIPINFSL